jgi:hypothetical protein
MFMGRLPVVVPTDAPKRVARRRGEPIHVLVRRRQREIDAWPHALAGFALKL